MGQLYKLDFSNGKSYIGITTKTALQRFKGHCVRHQCGKDRSALYNAFRKHGEPILVILAVLEDREMVETEIRAIKAFNTLLPNGYNTTPGGKFSPFSDPAIAAKMIGNKHALGSKHIRSSEYREKLSASLKGNKNGLGNKASLGKRNAAGKRSPESIANIKAGVAYAKIKRKEIYCWEDDGGR